jgi:hypothetical protein
MFSDTPSAFQLGVFFFASNHPHQNYEKTPIASTIYPFKAGLYS